MRTLEDVVDLYKIPCLRSRLPENLRMLPHAPRVQMADIPEDSVDINI